MYYNTTQERQTNLFEQKNLSQNKAILKIFREAKKPLGGSDININAPITSIRRAIHTLTMQERLIRVGKQIGKYGRPEYTYEARNV